MTLTCTRRAVVGGLGLGALSLHVDGLAPVQAFAGAAGSTRTAWTFSFEGLDGPPIRLSDHVGKPVLVVNTASYCGFASQLSDLQDLWAREGPHGLLVLGVPSGDFGGQEAADAPTIRDAASSHGVTFPLAAKSHVTGAEAHPFYRWAATERPHDTPRWNFHKYLVGTDGHIASVFPTSVPPGDSRLLAAIARELRPAG